MLIEEEKNCFRMPDFEDAVLYEAARYVNAMGIVTRNAQDFRGSVLKIYTPEELLAELQKKLPDRISES